MPASPTIQRQPYIPASPTIQRQALHSGKPYTSGKPYIFQQQALHSSGKHVVELVDEALELGYELHQTLASNAGNERQGDRPH